MTKLRLGADGHACQGHTVDATLTWSSKPGGLTPEQEFLTLTMNARVLGEVGSLGPGAFLQLWLLVSFWSRYGQVAFVEFCAAPSPKKSQGESR